MTSSTFIYLLFEISYETGHEVTIKAVYVQECVDGAEDIETKTIISFINKWKFHTCDYNSAIQIPF
jgi:hypothetical protein